eukprot:217760-Chlamydomonas_euryale.AAC.2
MSQEELKIASVMKTLLEKCNPLEQIQSNQWRRKCTPGLSKKTFPQPEPDFRNIGPRYQYQLPTNTVQGHQAEHNWLTMMQLKSERLPHRPPNIGPALAPFSGA